MLRQRKTVIWGMGDIFLLALASSCLLSTTPKPPKAQAEARAWVAIPWPRISHKELVLPFILKTSNRTLAGEKPFVKERKNKTPRSVSHSDP